MLVGIDIQDVERLGRFGKDKLARIFSEREMDYFDTKNWVPETISGMFSAKEAFFKTIGTGMQISRMHDIEILHDSHGAPYYHLSPTLIRENNLCTAKVALSISHTKAISVAVCIIMRVDLLLG